ncbi:MAG: response regulator transcription factor [Chloroflexota bacterium]
MPKVLVVEDDRSLRETLVYNLRREHYTPVVAADAATAVTVAAAENPDLILLDITLPGGNGFDVCRDIRAFCKAPVIMLTARGDDVDRVLGLEMGADDYVTKPFSLRELLARVRANLRRVDLEHQHGGDDTIVCGPITLWSSARRVEVQGRRLPLQPKEFELLQYLMRNPNVALTRERLLAAVWGHDFVGQRTVDVHVRRLRSKLEVGGADDLVQTIHGVGYTFGLPLDRAAALQEGENARSFA